MAINKGTRANQASHERPILGKAMVNKKPLKMAKRTLNPLILFVFNG
jgi:hypothetical protein